MATHSTYICDKCGRRFESVTGNIITIATDKDPFQMDLCVDCLKKDMESMADEVKRRVKGLPYAKLYCVYEALITARYRAGVKE